MTACLLQEGVKDHGHLFLKSAPNHHALPRSKSIFCAWGGQQKICRVIAAPHTREEPLVSALSGSAGLQVTALHHLKGLQESWRAFDKGVQ